MYDDLDYCLFCYIENEEYTDTYRFKELCFKCISDILDSCSCNKICSGTMKYTFIDVHCDRCRKDSIGVLDIPLCKECESKFLTK